MPRHASQTLASIYMKVSENGMCLGKKTWLGEGGLCSRATFYQSYCVSYKVYHKIVIARLNIIQC